MNTRMKCYFNNSAFGYTFANRYSCSFSDTNLRANTTTADFSTELLCEYSIQYC